MAAAAVAALPPSAAPNSKLPVLSSRWPSSSFPAPSLGISSTFQHKSLHFRLSIAASRPPSLKDSNRDVVGEVEDRAEVKRSAEKPLEDPRDHLLESKVVDRDSNVDIGAITAVAATENCHLAADVNKEDKGIFGNSARNEVREAGINNADKPRVEVENSHLAAEVMKEERRISGDSTHSEPTGADELPAESSPVASEVKKEEEGISGDAALKGTLVAGLLLVGTVGGFGALGFYYKDQLNEFLVQISDFIEGYGPVGYAMFVAVYAGLEVLAIPAIPLTMSAGLLFGTVTGTIIVSISGTIAATLAFLIARYVARDRIIKFAEGNKKFMAIDKAIGENGFRVVTLLRLSPLLPFSLGNYLYGLTSVKLLPYVLGSWLGMLPGTWAYVSAGAFGRALFEESESKLPGGPEQVWTLGLGLLATAVAATYVTRLAKDAVKDIE